IQGERARGGARRPRRGRPHPAHAAEGRLAAHRHRQRPVDRGGPQGGADRHRLRVRVGADRDLRLPRHAAHHADRAAIVQVLGRRDCGHVGPCRPSPTEKLLSAQIAECRQHQRQIDVANNVAEQIEHGSRKIFGVMIESHLNAGAQKFTPGKDDPKQLEYGKSITDACINWDDSVKVLERLAQAVRQRRRS
ncbi:MAG: hypothetical protein EBX98_00970, partial [Burkholderiaceae bacterium]|nr:hypothetical protein [Burkholderiaceae bacterium]